MDVRSLWFVRCTASQAKAALATAFLLVSSFSITISAVYHGQVAHAGLCVKSSPPPLDAACPDTALLMQVQLVMASGA